MIVCIIFLFLLSINSRFVYIIHFIHIINFTYFVILSGFESFCSFVMQSRKIFAKLFFLKKKKLFNDYSESTKLRKFTYTPQRIVNILYSNYR